LDSKQQHIQPNRDTQEQGTNPNQQGREENPEKLSTAHQNPRQKPKKPTNQNQYQKNTATTTTKATNQPGRETTETLPTNHPPLKHAEQLPQNDGQSNWEMCQNWKLIKPQH
jgi:hypothetical protein